jgi:hypothetical protein
VRGGIRRIEHDAKKLSELPLSEGNHPYIDQEHGPVGSKAVPDRKLSDDTACKFFKSSHNLTAPPVVFTISGSRSTY